MKLIFCLRDLNFYLIGKVSKYVEFVNMFVYLRDKFYLD